MARIVPSDITQLALAGERSPELETLRVLRERLPADYTVFHGVHWSREYAGHTVYGEIDFVVVNGAGRVLVIEQKNGSLLEVGGGLTKPYPSGPKSVGDQVRRGLEGIREKFKRLQGGHANLDLGYLVYCPDHVVTTLNAAALDPDRVIDAPRRGELARKIATLLGPGENGDAAWVSTVEDFFRQTFEVTVDIHAHISAQERSFTRLSGGLSRLLAGIEMEPLRLRIRGTAGCGKTLIARQFFEAAVKGGQRPLLVCFNRPLREKLRTIVGPGGEVMTWNGFCDAFLQARGIKLDFAQMRRDPSFWKRAAERVIAETIPDDWKFDRLIVDEGQDFDEEWFEVLSLFLRDGADIVWLEDADQNIFGRGPVKLLGFVGFRSRVNFRTPELIARFIRGTLPFDFECGNDLPGMPVGVTSYGKSEDQPKMVGKLVDGLLAQGFAYDDIAVLTMRSIERSALTGRERAGRHALRQFTGEYDLFGNQEMTRGRLLFDSISRFKGQQAPAVILVDVDPWPRYLQQEQRRLFCGMTRATVRLELVVRGDNPRNDGFVTRAVGTA